MKVLITGAKGFLGRNLITHLNEWQDIEVLKFTRDDSLVDLPEIIAKVDFIFHLAGVNRPQDPKEFKTDNIDLTNAICEAVKSSDRQVSILYTSSIQADLDNSYGTSKHASEELLQNLAARHNTKVFLLRLPNIFGKWTRPNYNSVVATFCYNISHNLPIKINNPDACISLVYVDDVITHFLQLMDRKNSEDEFLEVKPQYDITIGGLAEQLFAFRDSRKTLITEEVGTGFVRALYSTYLSYLPTESFTYEVPKYGDSRGNFVEMLKTHDSGQVSFFTTHPGVTRGGHYHHSKTEKFLVIKGHASFRFRHLVTNEFHELNTSGENPEIVETVPGWTHDITNVGNEEMIVMLWANEIFDRDKPDTYVMPVVTELK